MWQKLCGIARRRPVLGLAGSVVVHLLVIGALFFLAAPRARLTQKPGDMLFVELPKADEPAPHGNPAARTPGPQGPGPAARPSPPPMRRAPAPRPAPATPPVARAVPRPQPAPRPAPEPPRVASAPEPEPAAPTGTVPAPAQPEAPRPAPAPQPAAPAAPAAPTASGSRQLAMVPPGGHEGNGPVDIRSAFRRGGGGGGAGGKYDGRGGIEGEPIPLDTKNPRYSDYLERVRRMIKEKWDYPCVKNPQTRECEYKSGVLVIEFGIAKDGVVPFVNVRHTSGYPIMDDYAVNAVKLASPFPPVPDSLSKKGIPIMATFNYIVESSLVNLLR